MIVVSNASPLIGLALVDKLDVLPALFGQIHIAKAVRAEVIEKGRGRSGADKLTQADWLITHSVSRRAVRSVGSHPTGLHTGEIETVALALELDANLILMDERLARKFAQGKGLGVVGTLSILKQAYNLGWLTDLRGTLDTLRANGFRFSDALYRQILSE